ncbi:MAG: cation:proton antiporter [Phycisphaerales bacterium]|nr:cation:proton antiporter [Planctomycetota bacterium]MCH8508985.1 cation:proton antiporter [Phycisphaerales bacterium]
MLALAQSHWSLPVTDPVLTFALVMLIILIAPLVMQRLRVPGIIGLIVAGVIVGPNALGILDRNETIVLLGTVGLLYIMINAGLEMDLNQFRRYRNHSLAFGSISYLVPQVIGAFAALWILGFSVQASILLASMFGSHTLLTYPMASRLGLTKNPAVTTAVGGTIVTDTSALLVLAVIARSTQGELGVGFWGVLVSSLAVYTAAVWWGLPWIGRWFFRTVPAEGPAHFVFLMAAGYLCAFLALVAGVQPILGAFLAGLAMNKLVPKQSVLMARVSFAGSWLFIPIFLISVGMLVDPRVFVSDLQTWKVAILMVVTVISCKFLAAMISRRILGYTATEGWVMFGLTVNQAAATLAAVVVGFELGIFDESVVNGTVMMIMASCLVGSVVMQKHGRELAIRQSEATEDLALAPKRILVPLRNPEAAPAIMDVAFMIREKQSHEPVYPLAVVQDSDDASAQVAAGEKMLSAAVTHAAAADIPAVPVTRLDTNAAEGIVRAIRELRISTVVMGWTGVSTTRSFIFGSVLDQLLKRCPQQFVVCRFAEPLYTAKRLVLVVPPFAHREVGFADAVATVKNLASQSGLDLVLSARASDLETLEPLIAKIKPEVKTETMPVPVIESWLHPNGPGLEEHDIFVLLAARENQVSWRPSIDRLPKAIMSRPDPVTMLVVYPSEQAVDIAPPLAREVNRAMALAELFDTSRVELRLSAQTPREVIDALLEHLPPDASAAAGRLAGDLERIAGETPIEITPGVVLLHTHTAAIETAMVFLATVPEGLPFQKLRRDAQAVFVLLTPKSLPASAHLQHLARIAGLLHDPANRDAILNADTPAALEPIFQSTKTEP